MSTFTRLGHWRMSSSGNHHWVSEHTVDRDAAGHSGHTCPRTVPAEKITYPFRYASFVVPNASCPVCGEPVYFYFSPAGGRVFFDDLGPPWPKHPCTDNGATPTYRTQGNERSAWAKDGWQPFAVEEIDWGATGAIVRGQAIDEHGATPVALRCGVAEAEGLGSLVALKWTKGQRGLLSTVGHDGLTPLEFPVKRLPEDAKISERAHNALVKADAKAFFEATTAEWEIIEPLKYNDFFGSMVGFRRGVPILALFVDGEGNSSLVGLIKEWVDDLVVARGGDPFSDAAWAWDRLIAPVLVIGGRKEREIENVAAHFGYGDLMPTIEAFCISSVTGAIRALPSTTESLLDGQLHEVLELPNIRPERYINIAYICELAAIRRVETLVSMFRSAMSATGFRLDFTRMDMRIQFCRDEDVIDLWLAYSDPSRGLLVTLCVQQESPLLSKLGQWPEEVGPSGVGLVANAPAGRRISRWLATAAAIRKFTGPLQTGSPESRRPQ